MPFQLPLGQVAGNTGLAARHVGSEFRRAEKLIQPPGDADPAPSKKRLVAANVEQSWI
jgi:hypothetical protein